MYISSSMIVESKTIIQRVDGEIVLHPSEDVTEGKQKKNNYIKK